MADAKVSELTAASSAAGSDLLYIVDGTDSKKITVENIFGSISTPAIFNDSVIVKDSQTVTGTFASTISPAYNVTYLADWTQSGNTTLTAGSDGQIVILIMSSNTSGVTVTLSGSRHPNDVAFSQAGHSATLIYNSTASKWYFIGGSATVS